MAQNPLNKCCAVSAAPQLGAIVPEKQVLITEKRNTKKTRLLTLHFRNMNSTRGVAVPQMTCRGWFQKAVSFIPICIFFS